MTWFEQLTGIETESSAKVRALLSVDGQTLHSKANGRSWQCGRLETPQLAELRERARCSSDGDGHARLRVVQAGAQSLHCESSNAGALFQVASQFNLLEMTSEHVTPEAGVGGYQHDDTQGPACAIAAGAGTIYRNYFAPVQGGPGQTHDRQIDCLADVGNLLGNENQSLWRMCNGYALPSREGLEAVSKQLRACDETERDRIRAALRIGIHWNTEVTLKDAGHTVSQAYCSAMPVAYTPHPKPLWEPLASLVLEAAYEATLYAAMINAAETGNRTVYLTLLGGGAFGNPVQWVVDAARQAIRACADAPLDIAFVSRSSPGPELQELLSESVRG